MNPVLREAYFKASAPCVYLTKPTPSGGKFWQITTSAKGISLHWGPIRAPQGIRKEIPQNECRGLPTWELWLRVQDKLREGYKPDLSKCHLPLAQLKP